ncbi:hypothetical protein V1260_13690 [Brachybacterium sp. J144]|uniref:hypothetical protein n=1 Tax=Brachybacterium sp. J144 TaxID=3116487 RepID=UPI002E76D9FA|nr:hypothetical protein [Brachybacterium sp. J144]MEE1651830.1 hypothetical protein [Brachybacterium sp. J144]
MIDKKTAQELAERYRQAGGFRPFLLTLLALAHVEGGVWETPSKAAVRRALTRPNDEEVCSEADAEVALVHAVRMGLLLEGSTLRRLVLASAGDAA